MYLLVEVEGSRVPFSFVLALLSTTDPFSYEWSFYQQSRFFKNCIPSHYKMCNKSSYLESTLSPSHSSIVEYLVYPMDMIEATVDLNGQWETSGLTLTYFFLYLRAEEMYKLDKIDLLVGFL